jgi:hypothetical protein
MTALGPRVKGLTISTGKKTAFAYGVAFTVAFG